MRYRDAGVDAPAAGRAIAGLGPVIRATFTPWVVGDVGHFAGLCAVPGGGPEAPLLAASTDGVGTKLLLAREADRHASVAGDLVRHCVNDILVLGATPLFFLDYVAFGRLDPGILAEIVGGLAAACSEHGAALLGGETAEMPDLYAPGDYDLAGTIVGTVRRDRVVDGHAIAPGNALWALPSAGLHTNGFSLARRIVRAAGLGPGDPWPDGGTVADTLLAPHRSYLKALAPLVERGLVAGLAHITGGGIPGNLVRILPAGCRARVERGSWKTPAVFATLARLGDVPDEEMVTTFNLGVGMIVVLSPVHEAEAVALLEAGGERPWRLGAVVAGERGIEMVPAG